MTTVLSDVARLREALALFREGRLDDASLVARSLRAGRTAADAEALLGMIAYDRGELAEAERHHRAAHRLAPHEALYLCNLAGVRRAEGRLETARRLYARARARQPALAEAAYGLADVLERQGRLDDAAALIDADERARRSLLPKLALVRARIARRRGDPTAAAGIAQRALEDARTGPAERRSLLFLLGRTLESLGETAAAARAHAVANTILAVPYDESNDRARFDAMVRTFPADRTANAPLARGSRTDLRPILIVGMPRTGSTLLEQILHAHPQVRAAGESPALVRTLRTAPALLRTNRAYPDWVPDATPAQLDALAADYHRRLVRDARGAAPRLVDKALENHRHLGAVAAMLPGARVLHMVRNRADAIASCWSSDLPPRMHPWAADPASAARAFAWHDRLMAHWRAALDLPIHAVRYEAFVRAPEPTIRTLLEALDLPFDARCLRPHEAQRDVATLSYAQVSEAINDKGIGRARILG